MEEYMKMPSGDSIMDKVLGDFDMKELSKEVIGTFFLGLTAAMSGGNPLAVGAVLMAMLFCTNGHYNPAVTFSEFLRHNCDVRDMAHNWGAQIFGAYLASWTAGSMNASADYSASATNFNALVAEAVFAMMWIAVHHHNKDNEGGFGTFAHGLTVFAGISAAAAAGSGGCLNPATAIGLNSGDINWVAHVVGPLVGALVGHVLGHLTGADGPAKDFGDDVSEMHGVFNIAAVTACTAGAALPTAAVIASTFYQGDGDYNPAVSLGAFLRGEKDIAAAVRQVVGQLVGAFLAAWACKEAFNNASPIAAHDASTGYVLMAEMLYTYVWCSVVRSCEDKNTRALAVALGVYGGMAAVGGISGACFNPATGTAFPLVQDDNSADVWMYWVGPMLGAILQHVTSTATNSKD